MPAEARIGARSTPNSASTMIMATIPMTAELIERSTEPIVRARWALRCDAAAAATSGSPAGRPVHQLGDPVARGTLDDPVDQPGAAKYRAEQREHDDQRGSAAPVATMVSAERARKSLSVNS